MIVIVLALILSHFILVLCLDYIVLYTHTHTHAHIYLANIIILQPNHESIELVSLCACERSCVHVRIEKYWSQHLLYIFHEFNRINAAPNVSICFNVVVVHFFVSSSSFVSYTSRHTLYDCILFFHSFSILSLFFPFSLFCERVCVCVYVCWFTLYVNENI